MKVGMGTGSLLFRSPSLPHPGALLVTARSADSAILEALAQLELKLTTLLQTRLSQSKVRDYSASSDTASVELVHHGVIDFWMDGLAVHPAVNRAFLVHGADVTIQVPDAHALCQGIIVGSGSNINAVASQGSTGAIT